MNLKPLDVAIAGYSETPVDRRRDPNITIEEYFAKTLELILRNTGLSVRDFDGQGVVLLEPEKVYPMWSMAILQELGLKPRVVIRADQGGASGNIMLEQAVMAIQSGVVDIVLCICGDAVLTYTHHGAVAPQKYIEDYMKPYGMMGPNSLFAMMAQRYVYEYGITSEQVGKLAVTQRFHATKNPIAYFKNRPISLQDYLGSTMISDPVRLFDCCIPVNGGLAFIVASKKRAKEITDKPVFPLGIGVAHNYDDELIMRTGVTRASKEAFSSAGKSQSDVSIVEAYDDYLYAVMMQLEDSGMCSRGGAGKFIEQNDISINGNIPINTGGGQVSAGQAGMAGTMLPLVEAVRQLRGEGGERQVKDPKVALVTLVGGIGKWEGGFVNTSASILSNED